MQQQGQISRAVRRASRHQRLEVPRTIPGSERAPDSTKAFSQLPFSLCGLELTSAVRSRAAHRSSWAVCVHMIKQRASQPSGIVRARWRKELEIPSWTLADTPLQREDGAEHPEPNVGGITRHDARKCNKGAIVAHFHRPCPRVCGPLAAALTTLLISRATILHVVVSTPLSPTLPVLTDVAAFLTCMATIVQRVRGLGCWEPEVSA